MSEMTKTAQLSHLLARDIAKPVNQEIILDALRNELDPVDFEYLNSKIMEFFGVRIPFDSMIQELSALQRQGFVAINGSTVSLSDFKRAELSKLELEESTLLENALNAWFSSTEIFPVLTQSEKKALRATTEQFLNRVFVTHGVSCIKLFRQEADTTEFDINTIAVDVAEKYGEEQSFLKLKLPSIFSMTKSLGIIELLEQKFSKALTYLSTIVPNDIHQNLMSRLNGTIIYLDTSFIYRLLDLQGEARFLTAKRTLEFCKNAGVNLFVTKETYDELLNRIRFDAKVLEKYPIKVNLAQFGYEYRTEDNYISSYWRKASVSHISTKDYNESFHDPSVLICEQYGITIENSDEAEKCGDIIWGFYKKIRSYTEQNGNEKSESAMWHDAYCLAIVSELQLPNAHSAIDSKCLFLTTDRQLIRLQTTDHELKERIPISLTPSQLLQLFSFSTPVGDYIETFVSLFSSAAVSRQGGHYNNADVQGILSRISHYEFYKPEVVERILESQLLRKEYNPEASDDEKEEAIYKAISKELLNQLDKERDDNTKLLESKEDLERMLSQKNEEAYQLETERRQNQKQLENQIETERQQNQKQLENQKAETDILVEKEAVRKYKKWWLGHVLCMVFSVVMALPAVVKIFLVLMRQDDIALAQFLGVVILGIIAIPLFKFGFKLTGPNQKHEVL